MRVIITGGTGMIGSTLALELARDGHEAVVLSRNPDAHRAKFPANIQLVRWDAKTIAGWGELADGAHAIVNLAGEYLAGGGFLPSRWTTARKAAIRQSRVNAGRAVVEAIERAAVKPQVVVQSSAVGYYGPQDDDIITEAHPAARDFLADVCVDWEASTVAVEAQGVRRAIIRIAGIVLNPSKGALPLLVLPHRFFAGGPLGSGKQWYTWIHPADLVAAIRFLIDRPEAAGPFNLTAPNPETNADFEKIIGRVLNRPSWLPVPGFAMKLAFGEVSGVVLTGQRVIPERITELGFAFQYPNLEIALRDLLN